jgi:formyl-CoA transferase
LEIHARFVQVRSGCFLPFPRASQALSRFTVLDLTRVRSGPTCVRQLADWGANVIKIDALLEDSGGEQPGGPRQGSDFRICTATSGPWR